MDHEQALLKRIRNLLAFRVLIVTFLLGSLLAFRIGAGVFPYPANVFYIIVFLYAVSIICVMMLGRVPALPLAYMQIVADAFSAVTLIMLTGGIESWFSWVLILIVLGAAIVVSLRAAYMAATMMSLLYAATLAIQYYGVLPIPYFEGLAEKDFIYRTFSHVLGLYLAAFLMGNLTKRLERKDIDFEELASFNRAVIESSPSGLFTTDTSGRVELFNRSAELILEISREDVHGHHISEVLPFLADLSPTKIRGERLLATPSGGKTVGYTVTRLFDLKGRETGYIGIFQDLTELKALAREIKHKERLAAVGALSARIAHEIRNPLGSLKGSMEMLLEGKIDEGQRERLTRIALGEMDRLNSTITDLLSFSRPGALNPESFDIHEALRETLDLLRNRDDRKAEVEAAFSGPLLFVGDMGKIKDVFWNLGDNALEAMPDGCRLESKLSVFICLGGQRGSLDAHSDARNRLISVVQHDAAHLGQCWISRCESRRGK